ARAIGCLGGSTTRGGDLRRELVDDLLADLVGGRRVLGEELPRPLAALAEPRLAVAEPGAAALQDPLLDAEVEDLAEQVDTLAEQDVELDLPERRGDLVLDDRRLGARPARLLAVLDAADPADVDA